MKSTRRNFIKGAAIAGGAMMMNGLPPFVRNGYAFGWSTPLKKFIDPMPLFGADIPLAGTAGTPYAGVDYYQLTAGVFRQQLHSQLPNPTRLYGYKDNNPGSAHTHLGGAVIANKGTPVRISLTSALPASHILPYDTSIPSPGNGGDRQDRAAIHLHGGLVPWASDGGPFHWQCPNQSVVGASVMPWLWDGTKNVWDYFYPNLQSARLMWYHDHAIGQTRLNAYAGVATGYLLGDQSDNLAGTGILNQGPYNIPFLGQPIVFQDKVFWDPANDPMYTSFVPDALPGDLWYPWQYDPAIWPIAKGGVPPTPSAVPEFFGDTMLANGAVFPVHQVGVGFHRFRLLNACNARFLDLSFVQERVHPKSGLTGEPAMSATNKPIPANVDVWQIGTEGGFLPVPVQLVAAGLPIQPFILGPAERADILVRFNQAANVILYNVAGSPFPGGAPIFDWFAGSTRTPVTPKPGFGPNTRTILRFAVAGASPNTGVTVPTTIPVSYLPTVPDPGNGGLMVDPAYLTDKVGGGTEYTDPFTFAKYEYDSVPVELTLNEVVEPTTFTAAGNTGRLLTLIGNRAAPLLLPFGAAGTYYEQPPTEFVRYNTLRVWKVYNLTADAHPMHFHLFNVQILGRQAVDKNLLPKGAAVPPAPNEMGFKETVVMYPGEVTTVAALVEDPMPPALYPRDVATGRPTVEVVAGGAAPVTSILPASQRTGGDEYVWHCHILEHEEHDMMRPLIASE